MSRSLLLLSYLFPPRGGAGVQRALKFAKYLPQFGWRPLVVTSAQEAEDLTTRAQDPTLLGDLSAEVLVRSTELTEAERRAFDRQQRRWRRRLCATDPIGWWVEPAVRTSLELARRYAPELILVTMSPFTAARAGIRLKQATGLPLVLDLRDPWALDETRLYPTIWHAHRDWKAMSHALASADLVIMNTPEAARAARASFRLSERTRVICITNGYDADDFSAAAKEVVPAPRHVLRIVHTGMFHSDQARIWDAHRRGTALADRLKHARRDIDLWSRTPRNLLRAIESLVESGRAQAAAFELVLAGEITADDQALVERSAVRSCVQMPGYLSHQEGLSLVRSADVLFLPLHTPLDGRPALVVPGKTYEYLASRRPILAMGPPGDMRRFIEECHGGVCLAGDDVEGAARTLLDLLDRKRTGQAEVRADRVAVHRFERRALTRRLAGELDRVVREMAASGIAATACA